MAHLAFQTDFGNLPGPPKVPNMVAQFPELESVASIGSIILRLYCLYSPCWDIEPLCWACWRSRSSRLTSELGRYTMKP